MAVTRCSLATVRGRLIAALNAAPAGTWTTSAIDDARRNSTELDNAILAADARICVARASRVGDGYRSLFLSLSASIAHGGTIPDHLGPIEQVTIKYVAADSEYKTGMFDPALTLADIERWRANIGSRYGANHNAANSVLSGYYLRRGSQLFYTGADAKVLIATFTRLAGTCQAPESDEDLLFGLALGDTYKEGDLGPSNATIVADARAEYTLLLQREPSPSETVVLAA